MMKHLKRDHQHHQDGKVSQVDNVKVMIDIRKLKCSVFYINNSKFIFSSLIYFCQIKR